MHQNKRKHVMEKETERTKGLDSESKARVKKEKRREEKDRSAKNKIRKRPRISSIFLTWMVKGEKSRGKSITFFCGKRVTTREPDRGIITNTRV